MKKKELPESICILPWIHLEATSLGFVRPCCKSTFDVRNGKGEALQLRGNTLEEAWNSEDMVRLRKNFLDGGRPETCRRCWAEEAAGVRSKRLIDNDKFRRFFDRIRDTRVKGAPVYLDLKLGNICNLKCRICSSVHSSKWVEEELALIDDKERPKKYFELGKWAKDNPEFWKNLESLMKDVEYLDFTGGEPFLIKEHFELLKFCVERNFASRIEIHYNTNGTVFPKKVAEEYWPHFKRIDLMVSIDGIGKRFEYQRHGANWDEVSSNTRKLSVGKNLNFVLCHTVNIFNIFYLEEFIAWAEEEGYPLWLNYLHDPPYFCVQNLPETAKTAVQKRLAAIKPKSDDVRRQIERLAQFVTSRAAAPEITAQMRRWIDDSDRFRGESFVKTFPEYAQVLAGAGWTWS